ncbi:hypothetical protein [Actinacidiphila sp. bgisy160]|uniref:hypothetical protein n=1 Tax=Actinacidiphila sp. bgisy160 TaxID=3413796 RepID=UPI003D765ECF
MTRRPSRQPAPVDQELHDAIYRALRTARVIDPDDGTVPFYKADEYVVWTGPEALIATIAAHVKPFTAIAPAV